jgi:hypothetical protein
MKDLESPYDEDTECRVRMAFPQTNLLDKRFIGKRHGMSLIYSSQSGNGLQ